MRFSYVASTRPGIVLTGGAIALCLFFAGSMADLRGSPTVALLLRAPSAVIVAGLLWARYPKSVFARVLAAVILGLVIGSGIMQVIFHA